MTTDIRGSSINHLRKKGILVLMQQFELLRKIKRACNPHLFVYLWHRNQAKLLVSSDIAVADGGEGPDSHPSSVGAATGVAMIEKAEKKRIQQ